MTTCLDLLSSDSFIVCYRNNEKDSGDYCFYCYKRFPRDEMLHILKPKEYGEPEIVFACLDCYLDNEREQKTLAIKVLKRYLDEYGIDILEDDADYSDDPQTARYSNYYFADRYSDLFSSGTDVILTAASIADCVKVGHRK